MARFDRSTIRRYYDRHTGAFVSFGQGGSLGTLHRAVWGPGATSRDEAFRYVEDRIAVVARELETDRPLHVLDLGCGVGASLCYLAGRMPIVGTGLTVSPTQAEVARQLIRRSGLFDRIAVIEADYSDIPDSVPRADLAFAIESFVHAPDPERFLGECQRLVRPDGALVICDDFRRPTGGAGSAAAIERFRRGWHINTLIGVDELLSLADRAGFHHQRTLDLSPHLEIGRARDRAIDVVAAVLERVPWRWPRADPWLGGSALQTCLRKGWIGYELVVFRRR